MFAYVGLSQNLMDLMGFAADPVYGRAKCLPMLGSLKSEGPSLSWAPSKSKGPKNGRIPLTLRTSVHWGRPLHVFGLASEVSVLGTRMSLTMGYHGPSADLLYPGVCASLYLFGLTQTPD